MHRHYCEYKKTPDPTGDVLRPLGPPGKWLVVFCDEVNLPARDPYGTQRVLTLLRQLAEKGGFWLADKLRWVRLERSAEKGARRAGAH